MPNETLVLIPPMLCDAGVFGPQILDLANDHAVMFAPITHGDRMEAIASQILSWAPAKYAVAGMGMGGMIALEMMRRAPERVTRIALIASSAQCDTPQIAAAREPGIIAAKSGGRWPQVLHETVHAGWLAPSAGRASVVQHMLQMGQTLGPAVFINQSRALQRRRDQQSLLCQIRQPALVICGRHDDQFPVKRQSFMAEMIPNAKLHIIEGAGYMPTLEAPDDVTAALRGWMNRA